MTKQAYWIDRMADEGPGYVAKCGGRFRDVPEERGPYTGLDIIPANCTVPWVHGSVIGEHERHRIGVFRA